MSTDSRNSRPEWKRRIGHQSVSVFVRQRDDGDDAGTFRTVALQCSFKDRDGQWQNPSVSFTLADINNGIRLLELARQHMEIISETP